MHLGKIVSFVALAVVSVVVGMWVINRVSFLQGLVSPSKAA